MQNIYVRFVSFRNWKWRVYKILRVKKFIIITLLPLERRLCIFWLQIRGTRYFYFPKPFKIIQRRNQYLFSSNPVISVVRKQCVRFLPLSFFLLYYSNAFTTIAWRWTKAKMRNDNKFVFEFQPKTTRYSIFYSSINHVPNTVFFRDFYSRFYTAYDMNIISYLFPVLEHFIKYYLV